MKKFVIVLVIGMIFTSCTSDNSEIGGIILDVVVGVKYLDEDGNNLLDKVELSDIILYYKVDNEWVLTYKGNKENPVGLNIEKREDGNYLFFTPNLEVDEINLSETKIEITSIGVSDIIKTEISYGDGNDLIVHKVWYNDIMKWEPYETERMFEIVI